MLKQQEKPDSDSPVAPSDQGESTHPDTNTADKTVDSVPATVSVDLEIDPVAYQYESWSEMADGWVESVRSTPKTMPDPDHEKIRKVTPLVPLEDVEAMVEQLIVAGKVAMPPDHTDTPEARSTSATGPTD